MSQEQIRQCAEDAAAEIAEEIGLDYDLDGEAVAGWREFIQAKIEMAFSK